MKTQRIILIVIAALGLTTLALAVAVPVVFGVASSIAGY